MVTKLAIAFFPTSTKEMSEDDTPHDESYQIRMNTVHLTSETALRSQFEYTVTNRI